MISFEEAAEMVITVLIKGSAVDLRIIHDLASALTYDAGGEFSEMYNKSRCGLKYWLALVDWHIKVHGCDKWSNPCDRLSFIRKEIEKEMPLYRAEICGLVGI